MASSHWTTPTTAVPTNPCQWCGVLHYHQGICPRVKAIEYHGNGSIKRVEFHDPTENNARPDASDQPGGA